MALPKIFVKVKTGSRETSVEKIDEGQFLVQVKERRENGKANRAVIIALAEYFAMPKSNITIISGHVSNKKIVSIDNKRKAAGVLRVRRHSFYRHKAL